MNLRCFSSGLQATSHMCDDDVTEFVREHEGARELPGILVLLAIFWRPTTNLQAIPIVSLLY